MMVASRGEGSKWADAKVLCINVKWVVINGCIVVSKSSKKKSTERDSMKLRGTETY